MKNLSQLVATMGLLLASAMMVGADPIDPVFTMSDPDTGTPVLSTSFSFSSNQTGGGFLPFMNESQLDWRGLSVQVVQPTGSIISCSGGPFFSTCLISSVPVPETDKLSIFNLSLLSISKQGGLLNGEFFTINLNDYVGTLQPPDANGNGGWGANTRFDAQVTDYTPAVPEPATFLLAAVGAGVVFMARRLLSKTVQQR